LIGREGARKRLASKARRLSWVYSGVTHAFAVLGLIEGDFFGHHMAHDSGVTRDAQQRADAFIAAHMKEPRTQ
jgi:hypothetical protein